MTEKNKKTNAMRILDDLKIDYSVLSYDCSDGNYDGVDVAAKIGLTAEQVYKTLVTFGDNQYVVCLVPANKKLDLKALAKAAGVKKLEMIPVSEINKTTGYLRGGCSPIGMKKAFATFIDENVILQDKIAVSAGLRGLQIYTAPQNLIDAAKMTIGEFAV